MISSIIRAMGIGAAAVILPTIANRLFESKDDTIIRENREEFLKYYYNDLIQGQAP